MLTRSQRLIVRLILYVPVLIMTVWCAAYVVRQVNLVMLSSAPVLSEELSRRLGREIRIGRSKAAPLGTLVLEDLRISAGPTFAQGTMLSAERVRVHYDPRGLIFGGLGAGAVSTVDVVNPKALLVRRRDGTFNVADLLKPRVGPPGPPFKGRVRIVGGSVLFRDYSSALKPQVVSISVHGVNAVLDAGSAPVYSFRGTVLGEKGILKSAWATGQYNSRTKSTRVDVIANDASAPFFSRYVGLQKSLNIVAGTVDASAGVVVSKAGKRSKLAVSGLARLSDASVRFRWLSAPVTGISGNIVLAKSRAAVDVVARPAGSPARVTGVISDFQHPRLDLSVRSSSLNFAKLIGSMEFLAALRQVRPTGSGPALARITGSASNPVVQATATVPRASYRGYAARQMDVSVTYARGVVDLRSARFTVNGAQVSATGVIGTRGRPTLAIKGQVKGLEIARLPGAAKSNASGRVNADFTITGGTANPTISATARMARGTFQGVPFSSTSARVRYEQGKLTFAGSLAFKVAGGLVRVTGRGAPSGLNVRYALEGVDLSRLGDMFGVEGLEGIAYSSGSVTGKTANPSVTGVLEVFKGHYRQYETDYLRVAFSADRRAVNIREGIVRRFPADLRFAAQISGVNTKRYSFKGEAHASRVQVEKLLALLGRRADVTGTISGDFTFSGAYLPDLSEEAISRGKSPFENTLASGTLTLQDGSAFGYLIDTATAGLNLDNNTLTVSETVVRSGNAELSAGGTVALNTKMVNASFSLTGFDLARIRERVDKYVVLGGVAGASGTITGPWDKLVVAASAQVDRLSVNGTRFDKALVDATYSDNMLANFHALLARNGQSFEFTGIDYDLSTNCVASVTGTVQSVSMSDTWSTLTQTPYLGTEEGKGLREALRSVPRLTGGVVNGSFEVNGCLEHPNGSVKMTATDVGIDIRQVQSITLDASATNGVVMLKELRAVSEETYAEVTPITPNTPVYENGKLHLAVSANNLDLSRLRPWLGDYTPKGIATADFVVEGEAAEPSIRGSVEVANPGYGEITFERLRVSRIDVLKDKIQLSDIILATNGHQAVAEGYLPWSWSAMTVPRDKPLQVSARLTREDLSLLGAFVPGIDAANTSGAVDASLDVGGTLDDLSLDGSFKVVGGTLTARGFTNRFSDINVDLLFDGRRILVNQFSAQSDNGGTVAIQPNGYITVAGENAGINLQLVAKGLALGERNVLGYQEDVSLKLNAGLRITGSLKNPVIANLGGDGVAGGLTVFDAAISFVVPENAPQTPALVFPIDPLFQGVSLTIGDNVRIRPPQMALLVSGGGSLNGRLSAMKMELAMTVEDGTMQLAATRLRVTPGGVLEVTLAPPAPATIILRDFQATTTVSATGPLGRSERYQITMNVSGPVSDMQIDLRSNPPGLSREQMLAAMGHVESLFASGEVEFQKELANVLTAVGTSALFLPVERLFVEKLGFEEFSLDYSTTSPLSLYVSRRLFGSFYVSFYQALSAGVAGPMGQLGYQFQFSYRFKQAYEASIGIDDQQTTTVQVGVTRSFW